MNKMNENQALASELMTKITCQTLKPSSRTYTAICENPSCRNAVKSDGDYCTDCLWHQMASLSVGDLANKYVLLCEERIKHVRQRVKCYSLLVTPDDEYYLERLDSALLDFGNGAVKPFDESHLSVLCRDGFCPNMVVSNGPDICAECSAHVLLEVPEIDIGVASLYIESVNAQARLAHEITSLRNEIIEALA